MDKGPVIHNEIHTNTLLTKWTHRQNISHHSVWGDFWA